MKTKIDKLVKMIRENPEYMKDSRHMPNMHSAGVWPRYIMDRGVYDTYVRIYREGYYWLVRVRKGMDIANNSALSHLFDSFNEECYRVFHLYRIDPEHHKLLDAKQESFIMYYLDSNQQDETDRIKPPLA